MKGGKMCNLGKIGLWSDCHNFLSLPLMKLLAYHKSIGGVITAGYFGVRRDLRNTIRKELIK